MSRKNIRLFDIKCGNQSILGFDTQVERSDISAKSSRETGPCNGATQPKDLYKASQENGWMEEWKDGPSNHPIFSTKYQSCQRIRVTD